MRAPRGNTHNIESNVKKFNFSDYFFFSMNDVSLCLQVS